MENDIRYGCIYLPLCLLTSQTPNARSAAWCFDRYNEDKAIKEV